jgi:hypothetical protein
VIDNLHNYYGQAVKRNICCLEIMRGDVWAMYFHKISTDKSQDALHPNGTF